MHCFTLHDATSGKAIQQEAHTGFLFLGSSRPTGRYCLDLVNKSNILRDSANDACIVNTAFQLQCLDPTPGFSQWGLRRSGGRTFITVDGAVDFKACPADEGGEMIWGVQSANKPGCRTLRLAAVGIHGERDEYTD
ncbi:hypothetical protein CDD83_11039 [Cordyceps sp. RAO-2017]|nr:hypothetical protein CDD83_11039 [Cordyceps sp. RAO-2017]